MTGKLCAEDVKKLLDLEPNATCGFVRLTFVSPQSLAGALPAPFAEAQPAGSALYFMVTPEAPVRLHRIRIPGNTFHTARLLGGGRWFLGASTEWPGVIPADVEIGNLDMLAAKYPAVATEIRAIAASVRAVA